MLEQILFAMQVVGGVFYLLNKIFFSMSERTQDPELSRTWKLYSWLVFLIGLPAWLFILSYEHNWIATALEAFGGVSIILGLWMTWKRLEVAPSWLNQLALILIPIGLSLSLYDFGGVTTFNQLLEVILSLGFLVGTNLLAKDRPIGYLWYILMHIAAAWLMFRQNYFWLGVLQVLSLLFIIDAYMRQRQNRRIQNEKSKQKI